MMTAVLFPGQGSQEPGMGRDAAEARADCMEMWELAEKFSGHKLREIYWDASATPEQADTRYLQPALTVVNLGLWLASPLKKAPAGLVVAAAGHSLGEWAALAAAGALSIPDVIELTALRGKLMAEAGRSGLGMAAILKMDRAAAEAAVEQAASDSGAKVWLANLNTPGQFVASGESAALDVLGGIVKAAKGRMIPLAVSGAFHTPLMAEPAAEFAKVLAKKDFAVPAFPVVMNVTATPLSNPAELRTASEAQMTGQVRWIDSVQAMYAAGARKFIELGPKAVLAKMVAPNLDGIGEAEAVTAATLEQAVGLPME